MPASRTSALPDPLLPLYARLRDQLRAEILGGRLKPLDRLPSESELIAAHGVSRITVRQALGDLHKEGLIVKVHGKGSYVAPARVAQDLATLRGLAESVGVGAHSVHGRTLSLQDLPARSEVARLLELEAGSTVTELVSLRYLDREPLCLNRSYVAKSIGDRLRRIDFANRDLLDVYENELGLPIGHADLEISAASADKLHARHLKTSAGAPLLCVQRLITTRDARPLHLELSSYRSDAFSYKLRLERMGPTAPSASQ
jgi:GntR family transcriptional regulator